MIWQRPQKRWLVLLLCLFAFLFFANAKLSGDLPTGIRLSHGHHWSLDQKMETARAGFSITLVFLATNLFLVVRPRAVKISAVLCDSVVAASRACFDPHRFLRPPPRMNFA